MKAFAQQPSNDLPCGAIELGTLSLDTPSLELSNGSNVGATNETYNDEIFCPLVGNTISNSVYYNFSINTSEISNFNLTLIPKENKKFDFFLLEQSSCGGAYRPFFDSDKCSINSGDTLVFNSLSLVECLSTNKIMIMVSSKTETDEGDFKLILSYQAPTYCDNCLNGTETEPNGPYQVTDFTSTETFSGASTGSFTINSLEGGHEPFQYSIDGTNFQEEVSFNNLAAGDYTATVQDKNGCTTTIDFTIEEQEIPPPPEAEQPDAYCSLEDVVPIGANGENIQWYSDGNLSQLITQGDSISPTQDMDTLFVTQTINDIESTADTVIINFLETDFSAVFTSDASVGYTPFTVNFTPNLQSENISYIWNFGDGNISGDTNSSNTYIAPGSYTVQLVAISNTGCVDTTSNTIEVIEALIVPNAISPNGDGINDTWMIDNIEGITGNEVKIFNQWGARVFATSNYQNDWNGEGLPDATYFYVIDLPGDLPSLNGYILLMR